MKNPIPQRSVEYNDNRLSLYSAQKGKCAITKEQLLPSEIHCHHKTPLANGGTDAYKNLIIVHVGIHTLIHAKLSETCRHYKEKFNLNEKQLERVNELRLLAGNEPI